MYDRLRYATLLCLAGLSLSSSECEKEGSTPTEDDCDLSKYVLAGITEPVKIIPGGQENFYLETPETIQKDCHGFFTIIISRLDPNRKEESIRPAVNVEMGTNYLLGAGFPVTIKQEHETGKGFKWKFTANQGAKNLVDGSDWRYTIWVETLSSDPKDSLLIESGGISYIPKNK